jgi:raffinose synthase
MPAQLDNHQLIFDGLPVLVNLPDQVRLAADPTDTGAFLHFSVGKPGSRLIIPLGKPGVFQRFAACHRFEPFFMTATCGDRASQVPKETQSLLLEIDERHIALLIPLVDGIFRTCLQGSAAEQLELAAETGSPQLAGNSFTGLFIAVGEDPYLLTEKCAAVVNRWMGTGRLRAEKQVPAFIDRFGWCTWDAFYKNVSHDLVREGLETFRVGGVQPKFLLLDDGWQSEHQMHAGERRLTGFPANEKFPGDLAPTVRMSKDVYGIETFLVWHAMIGYWGGVDGKAMPGYNVHTEKRDWSPGILSYFPDLNEKWGNQVGVIPPEDIYRFFQDYHRHLRMQGVDGVKVDNQSVLEAVAKGSGGRVAMMRQYHEALEGSVHTHFQGNMINCMSNANEMIYSALNSSLMRTSIDFWPNIPESHGIHLFSNAQVDVWFGEFIHPDWDMFQSGHPMGALHAAGRAVSGGPVYVSDKPEKHDFPLLRKLVLPDGTVLRARLPGRPTRDSLFIDPVREPAFLKIFNHNLDAGMIGVFNVYQPSQQDTPGKIFGNISPADVAGLTGERFAVFAHSTGELRVMAHNESWTINLPSMTAEVFTVTPIRQDVAPIGLVDMFNSAGAILSKEWLAPGLYRVQMRGPGRCWIWSEKRPARLLVNQTISNFNYDPTSKIIEMELPDSFNEIRISF